MINKTNISTVVILLMMTACGSNYYLRRSKINMLKAIAHGAKLDSVKTQVKETISVSGIHDEESKDRYVNVNALDSLCNELRHQLDSVNELISDRINKGLIMKPSNLKPNTTTVTGKTIKDIQNLICPNVTKDTTFSIPITAQGKNYFLPIHIKASSIAGHASLLIDSKKLDIPYVRETIQVNAQPRGGIRWWHLVIGIVSGIIVGFILGKIFKFGVNL